MATKSIKDAALHISGYDVTTAVTGGSIKESIGTGTYQALGSAYDTVVQTVGASGEVDIAAVLVTATIGQVVPPSGSADVAAVVLDNVRGGRFYGVQTGVRDTGEVTVDAIDNVALHYVAGGTVNWGYVVEPMSAHTTGANTDATYADGLASSTGATAYLICNTWVPDSATGLVVKVRSCATSGGVYADCSTAFTTITTATLTATRQQVVALSGTVNRYLSISWAWTGTPGAASATFFVGVARD